MTRPRNLRTEEAHREKTARHANAAALSRPRDAKQQRAAAPHANENRHLLPTNIRGLNRVVIDAIIGITDLVEAMHVNIAHLPGAPRPSTPGQARGITGFAYRSVRAVTNGVGHTLDWTLARLLPFLGAGGQGVALESMSAAVNGVLGDYLARTGNPLAISMRIRRRGRPLDVEREALAATIGQPRSRLLVMVHGLCMHDLQWRRDGDDPVAALADDLGHTALYLHYNSGRHISVNGRDFSNLLESLLEHWPVPVESLTIVAHSMGGLVSRSAYEHAASASLRWPRYLRRLVFIATPHHGAPLERVGNWVDRVLGSNPYTAPLARLGKIRSAGITDLRYGNLLDADWKGRDRFEGGSDRRRIVPLPMATSCYAIAGASARQWAGIGKRVGDGLVSLDSALGRHSDPRRHLDFHPSRRWIGEGMGHLDLLTRPEVWEQIGHWLSAGSVDDIPSTSRTD